MPAGAAEWDAGGFIGAPLAQFGNRWEGAAAPSQEARKGRICSTKGEERGADAVARELGRGGDEYLAGRGVPALVWGPGPELVRDAAERRLAEKLGAGRWLLV